jgi:hypothetical protein
LRCDQSSALILAQEEGTSNTHFTIYKNIVFFNPYERDLVDSHKD